MNNYSHKAGTIKTTKLPTNYNKRHCNDQPGIEPGQHGTNRLAQPVSAVTKWAMSTSTKWMVTLHPEPITLDWLDTPESSPSSLHTFPSYEDSTEVATGQCAGGTSKCNDPVWDWTGNPKHGTIPQPPSPASQRSNQLSHEHIHKKWMVTLHPESIQLDWLDHSESPPSSLQYIY